jgi:prevent-host-death family protein
MTATDARQHFASVINRVARRDARVMVEKSGVPVAGIVSADDMRRLDQLDREREERFGVIDEMRAAFKGVSVEEIEQEAKRSISEARTETQRNETPW